MGLEIACAVLGVVIVVLNTIVAINTEFDADYYIGMSMCITFAIACPIAITVLSGIGIANIEKAPKLIYIFSIISLALSIGGSLAAAVGAAMLGEAVGKDLYWWDYTSNPIYGVNLVLHIVTIGVFIGVVILLISVIVTSAKNIKLSSDTINQGTMRASSSAASTTAASGGSGNFCSKCGAANEVGAKFCKKCGKAM